MLGLAFRCPKERQPYIVTERAKDLAAFANITHRYAQEVLDDLAATDELHLLKPGAGRRPNTYDLIPRP